MKNSELDVEKLWYEMIQQRIIANPYIPQTPTIKQQIFLTSVAREALFGGAAGPGKSSGLLMAALQFVDVPGYNALLLRRTYKDLALPDSIMDRAHQWLGSTNARWNGNEYRWEFPSSATLTFGYLASEKDKFRYQSAAFQFIGFDELTQFEDTQYLYLFSRLRRLMEVKPSIVTGKPVQVPIRMRSATNPGGIGHDWVYERFVIDPTRPFIPALMHENPYLDQDEYRESLKELDPDTRKQLEEGLWIVAGVDKSFKASWWRGKNRYSKDDSANILFRIHSWDTALTDRKHSANSANVVFEVLSDYRIRVAHVWAGKPLFPELPDEITRQYRSFNTDLKTRAIVIEGMASGKPAIQTLRASSDFAVSQSIIEFIPTESKEERAGRASVWCKRGLVLLPYPSEEALWLNDFESELWNFPHSGKKDRVDAFTQGILYLENYLISAWHGILAEKERKKQAHSRVRKAYNKHGKAIIS